jgi:hypothetical protein
MLQAYSGLADTYLTLYDYELMSLMNQLQKQKLQLSGHYKSMRTLPKHIIPLHTSICMSGNGKVQKPVFEKLLH